MKAYKEANKEKYRFFSYGTRWILTNNKSPILGFFSFQQKISHFSILEVF